MRCPACGSILEEIRVSDVTLDICQGGCGGVWFDRFELKKLDETHEPAVDLFDKIHGDESIRVDTERRRKCPKCKDLVMMRHYFSIRTEVEVDECPGCAGFWLDHGELRKIRSLFDSEEDREGAAEKYFSEVFDGQLKESREKNEEYHNKARKFANMIRFLCPSYFIPGKQRWGAF